MKVFKTDEVRLYCGDALDVLQNKLTKKVSLLLTDPPYGIDFQSNQRSQQRFHRIANDDNPQAVRHILDVAWNKLISARHAYIFGPIIPSPKYLVYGAQTQLIWSKNGVASAGDLASPWRKSHEKIWFGSRVGNGQGRMTARLRRDCIIKCSPTGANTREHPNQKPIALLTQLIEMSSSVGEWVLDPFMGSGSTCVAAVLEGRRAIGIEIHEGYFDIAVKRVKNAIRLRHQIEALK